MEDQPMGWELLSRLDWPARGSSRSRTHRLPLGLGHAGAGSVSSVCVQGEHTERETY
jgi:hypothetical protein